MAYNPTNPNGQAPMASSQPVVISGDQTAIPISATSLPLPTSASQDGVDGTGITAPTGGSGIRGWLSGIYNKLSNILSINLSQIVGNTIDTNSGNKSAGTIRTIIATDQPNLTTPLNVQGAASMIALKVDGSAVTQPVSIASSVPTTLSASNSGGVICGVAGAGGTGAEKGNVGGTSFLIVNGQSQIYGWYFYNPNTVVAYVRIYNALAATVTGSSVNLVCVLPIPPVSGANAFGLGIACSTGICITISPTRNAGGALASDVDYNIFYKS